MKRLIRPGLGFGSYQTAWRTIQGDSKQGCLARKPANISHEESTAAAYGGLLAFQYTAPDQLVVLGINMREDATEIQPFLDEVGVTFPVMLDPTDEMLI